MRTTKNLSVGPRITWQELQIYLFCNVAGFQSIPGLGCGIKSTVPVFEALHSVH